MSSRGGGGGKRASKAGGKTPEQAHAEKVARAEENVRKAQARTAATKAAYEDSFRDEAPHGAVYRTSGDYAAAVRAQRSAETRLANLKAQTPGKDRRAASYERQIAQHEAQAAKHASEAARLRAEYEEYRRTGNAPTAAKAAGGSTRSSHQPASRLHLTPVATPEQLHRAGYVRDIDPAAPPDPGFLRALYGDGQLSAALGQYTISRLNESLGERGLARARSKQDAVDRLIADVRQRGR